MNTRKGKSRFKNSQILLDSGCSSTIVMGRLVEKLDPKKETAMQQYMQAGNITTNLKFEVDSTLSELIAMDVVTYKCHVDDSTKGRYKMILRRYILT